MGKFKRNILLIVIGMVFITPNAFAQWSNQEELNISFSVPPIALLDIEPSLNNQVSFSISPVIQSGASPEFENISDEKLWLNYSSFLGTNKSSRSIIAQITGGEIPSGIVLTVEASECRGQGGGDLGKATKKVELSSQPKSIVTDVGNCYTGDGVGNGHLLIFSIKVENYTEISPDKEYSFTVLYTIRDN